MPTGNRRAYKHTLFYIVPYSSRIFYTYMLSPHYGKVSSLSIEIYYPVLAHLADSRQRFSTLAPRLKDPIARHSTSRAIRPTRNATVVEPKMSPGSEVQQAKSNGSRDHEVEGEHNQWKFRAPYKVHEDGDNFEALYEGGCHCGRVKYQLSREKPLSSKYCHCTTCQSLHGKSIYQ
jgi:hypothetical protein